MHASSTKGRVHSSFYLPKINWYKTIKLFSYDMIWYDMIYLLTAIGLTPGGSSTEHIYTQTIHRTTQWKQNIQNGTYITIRIHKHNNKNI